MELTIKSFLIICPLVALAGFVDAIGGGGGLISLPAYLLAGLPTHLAIGTNKLSSACGTTLSTIKFIREKLVNWKLAIPTILAAILGSSIGAKLSLLADEKYLGYILVPVLLLAAIIVMNKKLFGNHHDEDFIVTAKVMLIASISALFIGMYDGFYGPGTGTFLIIVMNVFAKIPIKNSNAQAKVINLTTNLTSLTIFILNGQVFWTIGIAAALCNMLGNYLGSHLAIKKGEKITRPIILVVLFLLLVKLIFD